MLKILKSIFGKPSHNQVVPQTPRKPSEEELNYYQAQLDIVKAGIQENPADPKDMVPVPERANYRDGTYFGHPLNSFGVSLDETIPFLETHRDQSLWFSVVSGLNYDLPSTYETIGWIISQPDCDALVAVKAYNYLEGPYFCGKPKGDPYAEKSDALGVLRLIAERERCGESYIVELSYDSRLMNGVTGEDQIKQSLDAQTQLEEDQISILDIPEFTLRAGGTGDTLIVEYSVDEDGILVMPKSQAAILG
ncbi:DUF4274 domain-containing protein [uncultured Ruegeria sp.]|uniref:DUF4274 domain-containing protein n=1 Tax=uncultured Ruegeria sp. TaxID=259304 RepID=UPI002634123A|nr:DUF4274 domain-containing protein [uncultured Ruegeria sp.]